ncbi:hypothetical protein TNCV_4626151, partial [Trichonephila clavipes]
MVRASVDDQHMSTASPLPNYHTTPTGEDVSSSRQVGRGVYSKRKKHYKCDVE